MPKQRYNETDEQYAERKRNYGRAWRQRQLDAGLTTEGKPRTNVSYAGEKRHHEFLAILQSGYDRGLDRDGIAADLGIHPDAVTRRLRIKGPASMHRLWLSMSRSPEHLR